MSALRNGIPPLPKGLSLAETEQLRSEIDDRFARCVTDLTRNEANAKLETGIRWKGQTSHRVFMDPWLTWLDDAFDQALLDVRNANGVEEDVQSNGGHGRRPNGLPGMKGFVWEWAPQITRNLSRVGHGVRVDAPFFVTETGPGMRLIEKELVRNDDQGDQEFPPIVSPPPTFPSSSSYGCPGTGPSSEIFVTLAGIASCGCHGSTQRLKFDALTVNGSYSLPFHSFVGSDLQYQLASVGSWQRDNYASAGCTGAVTSFLTGTFRISVVVDSGTCKVASVSISLVGTPSSVVFSDDIVGTAYADPGEVINNTIVCGGTFTGLGGGTATVTW